MRLSHSLLVCLLRLSCLSPCVLQYRSSPLGLQVWIEPEHDIDVLQRVLLLSLVPAGGPGGRGRGRWMKPTRTGGLHPLDRLAPLKTPLPSPHTHTHTPHRHIHTQTHTHAHTHRYIHTDTRTHTHRHTHTHTHTHTHHTHTYTYTQTHTHTHIHTRTHIFSREPLLVFPAVQ